jgi:hypothetical protein
VIWNHLCAVAAHGPNSPNVRQSWDLSESVRVDDDTLAKATCCGGVSGANWVVQTIPKVTIGDLLSLRRSNSAGLARLSKTLDLYFWRAPQVRNLGGLVMDLVRLECREKGIEYARRLLGAATG